jgi:hypothetical protein
MAARVIAFPGVGAASRRDQIRRLARRGKHGHDPALNVMIVRDWFLRAGNPPLVYLCNDALLGIHKLRRQLEGLGK